ncbi:MAG: CPBP family intramembrane metalloprotease [Lachnospiraceae bacterium]|nr:CPBP family intramembrane metalloprotease [Lachnospiraceae bacterium]
MKQSHDKFIRILSVIAIQCLTFFTAYLYFKYLNENGGILSISKAGQDLPGIITQSLIVNVPILVMLLLSFVILRKKAVDYLALGLEKKSAKIIVLVLVIVCVLSLTRQLVVYDDRVTIVFKWIYYLVFVAFCEELEYRALMPAILKGRVHKYVEWILPNILFACAHLLLPMIQGKSFAELLEILGSSILGYVLMGVFWEWCKRKTGSLWVGVLIHAIMDFGV